jgi:type VI protein secretion system component VasK
MARRLCENVREEGPATNGTFSMRGFYLTAAAAAATATALTAPALPAVALAATASTAPTITTATCFIYRHLFPSFLSNHSFPQGESPELRGSKLCVKDA